MTTGKIYAEAGDGLGEEVLEAIAEADINELSVLNIDHVNIGPYIRNTCLLYTSPSPRDRTRSRMPSSA